MKVLDFIIHSNEQLNETNHLIKAIPANENPLPEMFPGQFVQILVNNSPGVFLRRPISVNNTDLVNNELWLLVKRAGEGT